jgi:hypothetical protein
MTIDYPETEVPGLVLCMIMMKLMAVVYDLCTLK